MAAKVSSARKAGQSVGGLVASAAILGALGYFVVLPVVGSMIGFQARMSYYREYCDVRACVRSGFGYVRADQAELVAREHKRNAADLCPTYLNASTFQQWTVYRRLSWCAGFPQYAGK